MTNGGGSVTNYHKILTNHRQTRFISLLEQNIIMPHYCNLQYMDLLVCLVEQELLTLPEHLSLPTGVPATQSLVLCVCFVDRCLSLCTFYFGHCVLFLFDIRILITPLVSSNSS